MSTSELSGGPMPAIPYTKGVYRHILNHPGQAAARLDDPQEQWFINDHCFYVARDGIIHWFGITNPYPKEGGLYGHGTHRHIGHATARHPFGPWQEHADALTRPEGTTDNIGASFVVEHGDGWLMLFCYNTGFRFARSTNLYHWEEDPSIERIVLGVGTRDPCIVCLDDGTYLLYGVAAHDDLGVVVLATSRDLVHWHLEAPVLRSDSRVDYGALESVCVIRRGDWYYLFVNHSHHQYAETLVFASLDPRCFEWRTPLCTLFGHASKVWAFEDTTYISHCGIEDRHWSDVGATYGLYLAELGWLAQT